MKWSSLYSIPNLSFDYFFHFSQNGRTALLVAATKDRLDVVALLLDRGANIEAINNVKNIIGDLYSLLVVCDKVPHNTIITLTSWYSAFSILSNCSFACFSQDGWTAMIWAAYKGHLNVVALLFDRGANIEAADDVIRRVII